MLNKNAKIIRITAYLKRWWNKNMKKTRKALNKVLKAQENRKDN